MKTHHFFPAALLILLSCNEMEIIFKATRIQQKGTERIEVYEDWNFNVYLNDSLVKSGNASLLNNDKLILASKPKSKRQTLIQSQEYIIQGDKICSLIYEDNQDTVQLELRIPEQVVNENDCFVIDKKFKI